jgi:cell division protein FtsW (lipid II flippase)
LSLLLLVAVIAALGMALTMLVSSQWGHALRVLAAIGAVILAALLLDLQGAARDRLLLPLVAFLTSLSVILLSRINGVLAAKQILWVVVGAAVLVSTYYLVERASHLKNWKYLAGTAAVVLMLVTVLWGVERNGARLWLSLFERVSFQPSEIAKLLMVIFLAGYIAEKGPLLRVSRRGTSGFSLLQGRYLAPMALMVVLCLALFVGQRDLGTAVLFFGLFVALVYLATGSAVHVVVSATLFCGGAYVASWHFPHVARRVEAWVHTWQTYNSAGYQPAQGLFALAEGGLGGMGLGVMPVTGQNLPEASTDLIFAVLGQDLGLAGAVGTLLVYALFIWAGSRIALRARESFEGLLAAGLTAMFALQTVIIVGGVLKLIPLTGLPLPFISYGGTSMLMNFVAVALLLAISRNSAT